MRTHLTHISGYLRRKLNECGFNTLDSQCHMVSVLVGGIDGCVALRERLLRKGFNVAAFIFPAVPKNRSLLRISVCADNIQEEIDTLVDAVEATMQEISHEEPVLEGD